MDGMGGEDTGDDTQGPDAQPEEEPLTTEDITPEYYDEIHTKTTNIIKDFQGEQQYALAENIQRALSVAQCFRQSYLQEKENNEKMKQEVENAAVRVSQAVKMSEADQDAIGKLKKEIDDAWKLADAAQIREQEAQESMTAMREKLEKIQKEAEKAAGREDGGDELGATMMKHKDSLLRERDRLLAESEDQTKTLQLQKNYIDELEKKREENKARIKDMVKQIDEYSTEQFREKRNLEATQNDLKAVTTERDNLNADLDTLKTVSAQNHRQMLQQQLQLAAQRANIDKLTTSLNINSVKLAKLSSDLDTMAQAKEKLTNELNTKMNLLKLKEDENNRFRQENAKIIKQKEGLMKKLVAMTAQKAALEQDVLKYKNLIATFEKEREASKKNSDQAKKYAEGLIRERDLVRKDLGKINKQMGEVRDQNILFEQQIKTLETDLKVETTLNKKLQSAVTRLEKERDKAVEDNVALNDKLGDAQDEIGQKQNQIGDQKEKIADLQTKVSNVQQAFETARQERNVFHRELQQCSEDRNELKERLKAAGRETDQLRDDVHGKEMDIVRLTKQVEKAEKEKQALKMEIQTTIISLQHAKTELQELKVQNSRLQKTIMDDEENIGKLKKRIDNITHEKDVIGTQLIRRNDEINLLKEKMGIIQLALDRGESQYTKRLDDIRLLKIEIANLRSQRNLLSRGLMNTADMRQEVLQLNRTLTQERVKCKAMEQEMLTPMNVHRWRKLQGKDPEKVELIEKIQMLQKRILTQTVASVARENEFKEYQKLYENLKDFVLKIPSHDVKERLNSTQRALTAKTKRMKALSAELNCLEGEIKSKDSSMETMKKELQRAKTENILFKKKEQERLLDCKEVTVDV